MFMCVCVCASSLRCSPFPFDCFLLHACCHHTLTGRPLADVTCCLYPCCSPYTCCCRTLAAAHLLLPHVCCSHPFAAPVRLLLPHVLPHLTHTSDCCACVRTCMWVCVQRVCSSQCCNCTISCIAASCACCCHTPVDAATCLLLPSHCWITLATAIHAGLLSHTRCLHMHARMATAYTHCCTMLAVVTPQVFLLLMALYFSFLRPVVIKI